MSKLFIHSSSSIVWFLKLHEDTAQFFKAENGKDYYSVVGKRRPMLVVDANPAKYRTLEFTTAKPKLDKSAFCLNKNAAFVFRPNEHNGLCGDSYLKMELQVKDVTTAGKKVGSLDRILFDAILKEVQMARLGFESDKR